ncbi:hypothetical protein H3221_009145 [Pseudomonas sp. LMG 31766]|uniref:Polysaccharide biosynthesis protein n=1 Tax=Pseudomonas chaetocerotis TaxID=2758695 RepID=A0A931D262_9PSED|nr:hypothetical protein [Pseudomonas chaetocerotis]MBZ9664916.1 hypothetical protein [Pseudomonas chaetocerotis]
MSERSDFLWLTAGRVLSAVIALASVRAVTTYLSPDQYGELALLISVQTFCGLFLVNPIGQYINLNTHSWFSDKTLRPRLNCYWGYVLLISSVGSLAAWLLIDPLMQPQLPLMLFAMYLTVVASTWNATLIPMLNMLGFRRSSVILTLITSCASLSASMYIVSWEPSATGWFVGQMIGLSIGGGIASFIIHKSVFGKNSKPRIVKLIDRKTIFAYCVPLAIATGLMWLQLSGYRFVVERYWGLKELAYFAIGLQLAYQLWSLAESIATQFLYPYFFQRISQGANYEEKQSALSDLLSILLPAYLILMGLSIIAAPYLLKLLVSAQFYGGVKFFIVGTVVEFCRVSANLLSNAAHAKRATGTLVLPYAAGVVFIYFGLYIFGLKGFEIWWAGIALIVGGVIMLVLLALRMYGQLKFKVYSAGLVAACVLSLVMSGVAFFLPVFISFAHVFIVMITLCSIGLISLFILLYNNPALGRMLNAKLGRGR